jgi:hypothetical protein
MELFKKLKINTESPVWVINMPDSLAAAFSGLDVKEKIGKQETTGQVMLFTKDSKELAYELARLEKHIGHNTLLWICYPKKSGSISSDLVLMKSWDAVFMSGYRGQSSASIDEDWSGLRITNAPRKKPSDCDIPMAERKAEGIDYVKRTVQLPADALAVLDKYKGMNDFFNGLSFTCKKEYVMAITDARKEDTRKLRISKMIEELQQKMVAKTKPATK